MADPCDLADVEIERTLERALAAQQDRAHRPARPRIGPDGQRLCLDCGALIAAARVLAMPQAVRCASCQAEAEQWGPR
jgi:RNA polymerase-binding transcription factor DksA